jgi:hypothetical protein
VSRVLSERERAGILLQILRSTRNTLVMSLMLVVATAAVDAWSRGRGGEIKGLLRQFQAIAATTYDATLGGILGVSGVFLGLYFTAVSVVASTVYAHVSPNIRRVLMNEQVGNTYVGGIATLAAVSTMLLSLHAAGFPPGICELSLVLALGVPALLSFPVLGTRALNFFDPVPLASYMNRELVAQIRNASPVGLVWQDPSFQAHYRSRAEIALRSYRQLIDMIVSDVKAPDVLERTAAQALNLLEWYVLKKTGIPSDSQWFQREAHHKRWLTAGFSEASVALQTGTQLQPEMVPDPAWVEKELRDVLDKALADLRIHENLDDAIALSGKIASAVGRLSAGLAIPEACLLLSVLSKNVGNDSPVDEGFAGDQPPRALVANLALSETHAFGIVELVLGLHKGVPRLSAGALHDCVSQISWRKRSSLYAHDLPRPVLEQLERLWQRVDFEIAVEGNRLSPLWYLEQLAAISFARCLSDSLEQLLKTIETGFADPAANLLQQKRSLSAAQVLVRGLETCIKFRFFLPEYEKLYDGLSTLQRVRDVPWPCIDWKALTSRCELVRKQLVLALARASATWAELPVSQFLPDYFGQYYTTVAQECYDALASGDGELFREVFASLFSAAFAAQARSFKEIPEADPKTRILLALDPIIDLLEVSGYSIIYSQLDGKDYDACVRDSWDKYLSGLGDPRSMISALVGIPSATAGIFRIPPRDVARTAWKQDLQRRLRDRGLLDESVMYPPGLRVEGGPTHASPIVRAVVRGGLLVRDAGDVFLVCYLAERPESAGIALSPRSQGFARALGQERLATPAK